MFNQSIFFITTLYSFLWITPIINITAQENRRLDVIDNVLCIWDEELFLSSETHPGNFVFGFPQNWGALNGPDGKGVIFPSGWNTAIGSDGRLIAYPPEWNAVEGPDGRIVAIPSSSQWDTLVGSDGRLVAFPSTWQHIEGVDGRVVSFPNTWVHDKGTDNRVVASPDEWKKSIGTDGRLLSYPADWITLEGSDGRKIGYPYEETILPNLVTVAGPVGPWTTMPGSGGRSVAFPARWKVFPIGKEINTGVKQIPGGVALIMPDLTLIAKIQNIINNNLLTEPQVYNYILYTLSNQVWNK